MARHIESHIQINCVRWFRMQYRELAPMLFAVPNGGARSATEAKILKAEGVTAGVSDLILLIGRGGFNALCIEMKTTAQNSQQRASQSNWQLAAECNGNKYVICRTIDEFINIVNDYLSKS